MVTLVPSPLWARLIYTVWRFVIDTLSFYICGHVVSFIAILLFGVHNHIPLRSSVTQDLRNKEQIKPPDQLNFWFTSLNKRNKLRFDILLWCCEQGPTSVQRTHSTLAPVTWHRDKYT